jgi:hypothetical protein
MAKSRFRPVVEDDAASEEAPGIALAPIQATRVIRGNFGSLESADRTAVIREVWGDAILTEPKKVEAILRAQSVIVEENATMLSAAINMGRAMLEAKAQLTPQEFQRGLRESRKAWGGWSRSNVSKLIAVAEFCDRHHFSSDRVPQSYTTLYEFAALPDDQFERTVQIGLFRPDVRRTDIQAFKHKLQEGGILPNTASVSPYTAEIDRIDQRLRTLENEAERARKRRAELQKLDQEWRRTAEE